MDRGRHCVNYEPDRIFKRAQGSVIVAIGMRILILYPSENLLSQTHARLNAIPDMFELRE